MSWLRKTRYRPPRVDGALSPRYSLRMSSEPATSSRPPASQDPPEGKPDAAPAPAPDRGPEGESAAAPAREPDTGPEGESEAAPAREPDAGPEGESEAAPAREPGAGPEGKSEAALAPEPEAPAFFQRCNILLLTFLTVFAIGFGIWLFSAGTRYRAEHAQATEGWQVGATRMLEITLVQNDKTGLSCASDQVIDGLRCGHSSDARPIGSGPANDPKVLQPYNTTKNELFLGAGLWSSPDLTGPLPLRRFSVVCNYNMKGVMNSGSIRFADSAPFSPLQKTVMVGTLTDCVIPR